MRHRLAGAETPGYGDGSSFGNGEEGVNNPLAGIIQNVQVMKNRISGTMSKNIEVAAECGGTIGVESAPGKGARFVIRLPLEREIS